MINDFTKYKQIIDALCGELGSKDFEAKFAAASANIPKSDRFLLKMEIKRLSAPCSRLVDLRGLVDGECYLFEHEERTHYLDDVAVSVFNETVNLYGAYTIGVYEAITNTENNFRVIYQKEKSEKQLSPEAKPKTQKVAEKLQYPAQLFKFGDYHNRSEERMNFSISISVNSQHEKLQCHSTDISVNGCKFKLSSKAKLQLGDIISIRFLGLEEEFTFAVGDVFNYEIKNIELVGNTQLVGVKRVYQDGKAIDGFEQFLKGFIQGNKRRYKINLDNTISALSARNFEQYVLPKASELPVFISNQTENFRPKYALTSLNNHKIFEYWQDESKHSTLHFLITPQRIKHLQKAKTQEDTLIVYSFIHHSQGKCFFYSADEEQLKNDENFKAEFLGFAANKSDFAITSLSLSEIMKDKVNSFYTLSNSLTKKNQYLNLPVSEENVEKIEELTYLVIANDITHDKATKVYQAFQSDNLDASKIKAFGHKRISTPYIVEEIGINYQNHRQESRFKFKTSVEVSKEGETWPAQSVDFSPSGLKLEFDEETPLAKGDVIHLSFNDLQKITTSFELKSLAYVIVRINEKRDVVNLRVQVEQHKHMGKSFFKALIEKNRHKLKPDEYASMVQGLVKPLRNLYSSSLVTPNLIIQTSGSRYKFEAIGYAQEYGKLMSVMRGLSDKTGHYNLSPILSNLTITNALMQDLKKMHVTDKPVSEVLFVAIHDDEKTVQGRVITKSISELITSSAQKLFMKAALKRGQFFCLQLTLSRTNVPDMEHLNPELGYISSYAIHKGKQIEKEIWSVAGVVQVSDITKEAISRIKLATS